LLLARCDDLLVGSSSSNHRSKAARRHRTTPDDRITGGGMAPRSRKRQTVRTEHPNILATARTSRSSTCSDIDQPSACPGATIAPSTEEGDGTMGQRGCPLRQANHCQGWLNFGTIPILSPAVPWLTVGEVFSRNCGSRGLEFVSGFELGLGAAECLPKCGVPTAVKPLGFDPSIDLFDRG